MKSGGFAHANYLLLLGIVVAPAAKPSAATIYLTPSTSFPYITLRRSELKLR